MDAREMNQNEELIDLLHLCIYMLKKWKSLLIFLLVGALLGAAVSLKSVEVRPQADVAMIDSMKSAAEQRKQYNELHKLLTKSPFLALHDVNVYSGSLEYHITDYTDLEHIVEEYFSIQKAPSLKEELCQILDLENDDYFDDALVMFAVMDKLNELNAEGKISCSCGCDDIDYELSENTVVLACCDCDAHIEIPAGNDADFAEIDKMQEIIIKSSIRREGKLLEFTKKEE